MKIIFALSASPINREGKKDIRKTLARKIPG